MRHNLFKLPLRFDMADPNDNAHRKESRCGGHEREVGRRWRRNSHILMESCSMHLVVVFLVVVI